MVIVSVCFLYLILWLYIPFSIYLYHVHYQTNMKPLTPQSHKCNNHVPKLLSAVLSLFVLVLVLRYDIKGEPLILILSLTSAVILLFFPFFIGVSRLPMPCSTMLFHYLICLTVQGYPCRQSGPVTRRLYGCMHFHVPMYSIPTVLSLYFGLQT